MPRLPERWFAVALAVLAVGVILIYWWHWSSSTVVRFDPAQPSWLAFGRGSGWHGLDTVAITPDGKVTLYRQRTETRGQVNYPYWETTALDLKPEALARVHTALKESDVLGLKREYHADIADGTQWVFWFRQGSHEQSIYFNNEFPKPILRFAEALDAILEKNGLADAHWQRVPRRNARDHEKELWESIER